MKLRVVLAFVLGGAMFLPASGAHAETILDGKSVKVVKQRGGPGVQNNEDDPGRPSSGPEVCMRRHCSTVPFVYQPAAGIRGGLMISVSWQDPLENIDIYLVHVDKYGVWSEVGACVGSGSTVERIYFPPSDLVHGARYVMVVDFVRTNSGGSYFDNMAQINVPSDPGTKGCLITARAPAQVPSPSQAAPVQVTSGPTAGEATGGTAPAGGTASAQVQGRSMPFWRSMALFLGGLLTGAGLVLASAWMVGRRPGHPVQQSGAQP